MGAGQGESSHCIQTISPEVEAKDTGISEFAAFMVMILCTWPMQQRSRNLLD